MLIGQIEMLRERVLGNCVIVTPEERIRLLKLGGAVGHDADDPIGIVSVKTYACMIWERRSGKCPGGIGRPRRMSVTVQDLILRLAKKNAG